MALVEQRQAARTAKNWPEADALRDQIIAAGYEVEDTPEGHEYYGNEASTNVLRNVGRLITM